MYSLKAENEKGEILDLTGSKNYYVTSVEGITPPTASIATTAASTIDGTKLNAARLNERNIVIMLQPKNKVEENRIALYNWFSPKKWVRIHYKNKKRSVYIEGYVESLEGSLFELPQTLQVSVICPGTFLKDEEEEIKDGSYTTPAFEFPFSVEESGVELSTYNREMSVVIENKGDVETGMIVEFSATGPVENPFVYRRDTLENIGVNFKMDTGDVIRINTTRGEKGITLIRGGEETNIINAIGKRPAWLQLQTGENLFTYEAESGTHFLSVRFYFHPVYEGV